MGTRHQPHSARSLELALRTVWIAQSRWGGGPRASLRAVRGQALSLPQLPVLGASGRGQLPICCGRGGCGCADPSPNPQRTLFGAGFARCRGGARAHGRGRLLPPCGVSAVGHFHCPDRPSLGCAADACYSLAGSAVCGPSGSLSPRGARPCGPYALWGARFASAPSRVPWSCACGARFPGLRQPAAIVAWPPFRVPWLWPAACVSGVPRGPALVRRASSAPVAFGALVIFPLAVVPSPGGDFRPQIYWAAARGTWRPAQNQAHCACRWPLPRQGQWGPSASYLFWAPRWGCPWRFPPALVLGCVLCGGLACLDSVTHASGFQYRPSFHGGLGRCTGPVLCACQHLPFLGRRTPRRGPVRVCLCMLFLAGSGLPASRARFGAPHLSFGRFVLLFCSAPSELGLPSSSCGFFCSFARCPVARAPAVSGFLCFPAPDALGLGALRSLLPPPPSFFVFPSVPDASVVSGSGLLLFSASGALGLGALRFPSPPTFFCAPPPPLSVCVVPCAASCCCLLCCVLCCGCPPCVVLGYCALCGALWGGFLCVVLCCAVLLIPALCCATFLVVLSCHVVCLVACCLAFVCVA